jgi:hypothetical protein|tara:strand:+ start:271 stop:678 length:408 start_codon:yes stop_codon:yes gene_type:complete
MIFITKPVGSFKKQIVTTLLFFCITPLLFGCQTTGASGEFVMGRAESPAWFMSASRATITEHFKGKCLSYGFEVGTNEFAKCMMDAENSARSTARSRLDSASDSLLEYSKQNQTVECNTRGTITGSTYTGRTTCN